MKARKGKRDRHEQLRALSLFAEATDDELDGVAGLMTLVSVEAGTRLTVEGAGGLDVLLVAEGRASVTRWGEQIAVIGPGELVGELSVLFGAPRSATVTALTPMRVYVMHLGEFTELLRRVPSIRSKVEEVTSERGASGTTKRGWTSAFKVVL